MIHLKKSNIVAFCLGLLGVFLMITLQAFEIKPLKLISPLIQGEIKSQLKDEITPKLSKFKNNYSIMKSQSFVTQASADSLISEAHAYGAIDYETGKVLVGNNIDTQLPMASITKIMTAVVALDLAEPYEYLKVTKKAAAQIPTKIGVVAGEQMNVEELLNAALLTSANDAVEVVENGIDAKYGRGTFVAAMNEKARLIGLSNTHFSNPQGFDSSDHFSTVGDLAVLSHYALTNYPLIAEIVKKDYEFLPADSNHKQFDLNNWNGLIGVYPNTIGFKIGNTGRAQYTTVVVSEREGKKVIGVILGAPGILERDMWASQVLDLAYQAELGLEPVNVTEEQFREKYSSWKYYN